MSFWPKVSDIASNVKSGKSSATNEVKKALDKIETATEYGAIISTLKEESLNRAKEIDNQIKAGNKDLKLAGVPFIAKDNFLVFGPETTAASNMLKGFKAPYQSTAINLLEAEGAICVAKANLDAFAHGTSTENSDFFVTMNPADKTRVAGGSSGGSAASVALDLVPFALGTDTGGSIRLPASFCGVVGYKPSYGLVSRSGVVAMASSTDVIGPLTSNVEDLALIMEVIAKKDPLDSTTIYSNNTSFTKSIQPKGKIKVGVIRENLRAVTDASITKDINKAIAKLTKEGIEVKEIGLPTFDLALAAYYILCPAEVSSNLSRYDGLRYGHSSKDGDVAKSRNEGFGREAKRRIIIGTYVLSSGYYDAYYRQAQLVRTKIINEFNKAFSEVDFLLSPVAPTRAFKIGEKIKDPMDMYLMDLFTIPANLAGTPAISLPIATDEKLPIGLQLVAPFNKDYELINFSRSIWSQIK